MMYKIPLNIQKLIQNILAYCTWGYEYPQLNIRVQIVLNTIEQYMQLHYCNEKDDVKIKYRIFINTTWRNDEGDFTSAYKDKINF